MSDDFLSACRRFESRYRDRAEKIPLLRHVIASSGTNRLREFGMLAARRTHRSARAYGWESSRRNADSDRLSTRRAGASTLSLGA